MVFKKNKNNTEGLQHIRRQHIAIERCWYNNAIFQISNVMSSVTNASPQKLPLVDQLKMLKFFLTEIKKDNVADSRAHCLYGEYLYSQDTQLFPMRSDAEYTDCEVALSDVDTIVFPVKDSHLREQMSVPYMVMYYPEIDLAKVVYDTFSLECRRFEGVLDVAWLKCTRCSLSDSFRSYYTDGGMWRKICENGSGRDSEDAQDDDNLVKDFRLALIFSVAQAIEKFEQLDPDMPVDPCLGNYLQSFCEKPIFDRESLSLLEDRVIMI